MTDFVSVSEALPPPTPANTSENYTNFHLSAVTFFYPPNPPPVTQCPCITQCPCEAQTAQEQIQNPNKHIRVYYNEPSGYAYNSDCYLIKESRYSTLGGWHSASDDLVADDAMVGSAVVAAGRWQEKKSCHEEAWKTSVYYIDKNGTLRERTNHSFFAPAPLDEFEHELPKPEDLVLPTPGWIQTHLQEPKLAREGDTVPFPTIHPLPTTKLTAAYSEDGKIHVFYQAKDVSIRELVFDPVQGWFGGQEDENGEAGRVVVGPGEAKPGTPLAVVAGGWFELRLYFVDTVDLLKEFYWNDRTDWIASQIPQYSMHPTAMLTAVAWNYASAYYQIRLFSTTNSDDLREISFSRNNVSFSRKNGGWSTEGLACNVVAKTFAGPEAPLSAVAAVVLEGEWKPKVYYHPRRQIIAEWDVCAKTFIHAGILKVYAKAGERRMIEEETRVKIREEEEKKRVEEERIKEEEEEAKRQEEERVREEEEKKRLEEERIEQEEEAKRQEEERVREEEEKKRQEELQRPEDVPEGGTLKVSDPEKAAKLQKVSGCNQGYQWKKESGGWRCGGGAHYISDADFDAL